MCVFLILFFDNSLLLYFTKIQKQTKKFTKILVWGWLEVEKRNPWWFPSDSLSSAGSGDWVLGAMCGITGWTCRWTEAVELGGGAGIQAELFRTRVSIQWRNNFFFSQTRDSWANLLGSSPPDGQRSTDRSWAQPEGESFLTDKKLLMVKPPSSSSSGHQQKGYLELNVEAYFGDFPGDPVVKTPCSQCRRPRFNPWSGN